jgi:hypothetical protein
MKFKQMRLTMSLSEARQIAALAGYPVEHESPLPDGNGVQLRVGANSFLNVYRTGVVVAQGRNAVPLREAMLKELAKHEPSVEHLFI